MAKLTLLLGAASAAVVSGHDLRGLKEKNTDDKTQAGASDDKTESTTSTKPESTTCPSDAVKNSDLAMCNREMPGNWIQWDRNAVGGGSGEVLVQCLTSIGEESKSFSGGPGGMYNLNTNLDDNIVTYMRDQLTENPNWVAEQLLDVVPTEIPYADCGTCGRLELRLSLEKARQLQSNLQEKVDGELFKKTGAFGSHDDIEDVTEDKMGPLYLKKFTYEISDNKGTRHRDVLVWNRAHLKSELAKHADQIVKLEFAKYSKFTQNSACKNRFDRHCALLTCQA